MNLKRIAIGFLAFFLIAGTAYAAGKSVSVYVNGKQVQSGTVIDGQTMLPLRAVAEALGAQVDWDGKTYSARITKPQEAVQAPTEGLSLAELNEIGESVPLIYALNASGQAYNQGSGVVIDGAVVTNHHVVKDSASLRIHFGGDVVTVPSNYLFDDAEKDLAAVKLVGYKGLTVSTDEVKKGDKVYVLGHPDQKFTLSEGNVRSVLDFNYGYDSIVSGATVNGGSSGGATVNSDGEVIGIVTDGGEGTSIAIQIKHVLELMN